ncbi:TPA: hypothetical protein ACH3X1_003060 [Trebouxia sp. C0004]
MLSWPSERKNHNYRDGVHSDVYDGEWWSEGVLGDDNIAPNGDLGRSLVFGICGDGVDPMDHKNYSMWPLSITCWNLPGHIRMTLPALGLLCIIPPGPNGTEPSDSSLSWIYLLTSSGTCTIMVWRCLMAVISEALCCDGLASSYIVLSTCVFEHFL